MPPGADCARDRGGNRAAHARIGHLLHQHDQRKNQRQPGQCFWPHAADEMGIDRRRDRDQHDVDDDVWRPKAQQRRHDRSFEKKTGAGSRRFA